MMRSVLGFLLLQGSIVATAICEERPYAVNRIPDSLRTDASAIVRSWKGVFRVKSSAKATFRVQQAVTIFSKEGRDWGVLSLGYDPFLTIEDLEGTLYDEEGNEVRTLDDKDIKDYSAIDVGSLFDDNRVRIASLYDARYPYTVVYEYELMFRGSLGWPTWVAQSTDDPVEYSSFTVQAPADAGLRYWCNRTGLLPVVTEEDGMITHTWSAAALPHIPNDVVGHVEDVSPIVRIAPTVFEMSGQIGRMDEWKDFGLWIARLYDGRGELPPGELAKVRSLVRPESSSRERARTVYRYLQKNTRYVSVQLGIGGWQPFTAAFVCDRKYGDCKALSNYAIALLNAVDVRAYPVLIHSGDRPRPMITEFPSHQFNHVVVCVPLAADTLWLECTSQTMAFGQLSASCSDREALMITSGGGVVVRVPMQPNTANAQIRSGNIRVRWDGSGTARATTTYTGYQQQRIRGTLMELSPSDRQEWVMNRIPVASSKLMHHAFGGLEEPGDTVTVSISFDAPKIASLSGNRLFLIPNLFERTASIPAKVAKRLSPVRLSYPYVDQDSVLYHIPADMKIEALPAPTEVVSPYAAYWSRCQALGDTAIVYTRMFSQFKRIIPAEEYEAYRTFMSAVAKADRAQVVLVKK